MNICAPFAGIVHYQVQPGQAVDAGDVLAIVEAVKLEAPVYSPGPGTATTFQHPDFADVSGGDLLLIVEEH